MSALPPEETRSMLAGSHASVLALGMITRKWERLHSEAEQLASFAHLAPERSGQFITAFPAMLEHAGESQRQRALQGIEDIDAMMQPGMTALRTISARGVDVGPPALALWREFHAAREAVIEIVADPVQTGAAEAS